MVSAIGSSAYFSTPNVGASAAGLEAQLARYQKALSECVNCDSAKTREGKQTIQDISSKISEVKARIEEATATKSNTLELNVKSSVDISSNKGALASGIQGGSAVVVAPAAGSATATAGSLLDVFA